MKTNGKPKGATARQKVVGVTLYPGDLDSVDLIKREFGLTRGSDAIRLALREMSRTLQTKRTEQPAAAR